jgi:hypothetical protein
MNRALKIVGWTFGISLLLGVALVAAAVALAGSMPQMSIQINGEPLVVAQLDAAQWLLAVGGVALALLIVALVVPLAVLLPLGIVAVVLLGVLLALAGVAAIVCSPLILLVAVIWLMVRLTRRSKRPAGGATMTG